jgi:hypothetical protein
MNFFGQKEEKPAGPDPLFAGACRFVEVWASQHASSHIMLVGFLADGATSPIGSRSERSVS